MQHVSKRIAIALAIAAAGGAGWYTWQHFMPGKIPTGIASGNGRLEATEIDIAAKLPARVREVLVHEGDFVVPGQVLAVMDTDVLEAQRREAEAQLRRAIISVDTAQSQVVQREAERAASTAQVAQREAELDAAKRRFVRSADLVPKGAVPEQRLDDDRAQYQAMLASVSLAKAQVAAADAALSTARSEVIGAQASVEALRATIERIQADIRDSILKSPCDGRVQYRIAEPGEVMAAGGRVVNLVNLTDVYMTFFLPERFAGRVKLGSDVRLIFDALPQYVVPAKATFVSAVAQFTPKAVETAIEREKLMFRVKAHIPQELLRKYIADVKTGVPGMAYVKVEPNAEWPAWLEIKLPEGARIVQ